MTSSPTLCRKIDVLDHGFVRLVDYMGDDLAIVRSARVSYNADWRAGENEGSDAKLIRYLMKNRHTTPFESVEVLFEIGCPIFTRSQWHRHRTQSYNEVSARYTELPDVFYTPEPELIGVQDPKNKQARIVGTDLTEAQIEALKKQIKHYKASCEAQFQIYHELLAAGWPRELARGVLPMSTYTRFFAKTNLHNWLHFLGLRADSHAQHEIRVYAEAIIELLTPIAPVAMQAWKELRA